MSADIPNQKHSGVLYVIAYGCSSASLTPELVMQAQARGWDVCVITTPNGKSFLNMPHNEVLRQKQKRA